MTILAIDHVQLAIPPGGEEGDVTRRVHAAPLPHQRWGATDPTGAAKLADPRRGSAARIVM